MNDEPDDIDANEKPTLGGVLRRLANSLQRVGDVHLRTTISIPGSIDDNEGSNIAIERDDRWDDLQSHCQATRKAMLVAYAELQAFSAAAGSFADHYEKIESQDSSQDHQ